MEPYKPPNLFSDDNAYVPRKLDKGKQKAEGVSRANKPSQKLTQMTLLEPLDMEDVVSHNRNSYHAQGVRLSSLDSDSDLEFESESDLTPSPPLISIHARPTSDGTGSDGDESFYQSVDEENSSDIQVCSFNSNDLVSQTRSSIGRWI